MKIKLAVFAVAFALAGCESQKLPLYEPLPAPAPLPAPSPAPSTTSIATRPLNERHVYFSPRSPTPEEENAANAADDAYSSGLLKSIKQLDDGVSPAESIGRAAVYDNIELWRAWKRVALAHLIDGDKGDSFRLEKRLANPPQGAIDFATVCVLKMRKIKSDKNTTSEIPTTPDK